MDESSSVSKLLGSIASRASVEGVSISDNSCTIATDVPVVPFCDDSMQSKSDNKESEVIMNDFNTPETLIENPKEVSSADDKNDGSDEDVQAYCASLDADDQVMAPDDKSSACVFEEQTVLLRSCKSSDGALTESKEDTDNDTETPCISQNMDLITSCDPDHLTNEGLEESESSVETVREAYSYISKKRSDALGLIQKEIETAIDESSALFVESDPPSSMSDGPASPCIRHAVTCNCSSQTDHQYNDKVMQVKHESDSPTIAGNSAGCPSHDESISLIQEDTNIPSAHQINNATCVTDEGIEDELLSELETELHMEKAMADTCISLTKSIKPMPNGLVIEATDISPLEEINLKYKHLQTQYENQQQETKRLKIENKHLSDQIANTMKERDSYYSQLQTSQDTDMDSIYQAQLKELEMTLSKVQRESQSYREKLTTHDAAAKRAIATLQNELKLRVDQVTKLYEECRKEKDSMVVKYAQAEQKNIELQDRMDKNDAKVKDVMKEREQMIAKFRAMKAEKLKAGETVESRNVELMAMKRELEKHREMVSSLDVKMKWAHNKLKAEMDVHKETRSQLEDQQKKLKEACEEAEQMHLDCQAMIISYQELEEQKTGSVDQQMKERELQLRKPRHEATNQAEVHQLVKREMEKLKMKHKEMLSEVKTWRDKVKCLEAERIMQEEILTKFKETLQTQKTDNKVMKEKVSALENIEQDLTGERETVGSLQFQLVDLQQRNGDLEDDMANCGKRETEHLKLTQKLTDKNAKLLSENSGLNAKVTGLTAEVERLHYVVAELEKKLSGMELALLEEKQLREGERNLLTVKLTEKSKAAEELTRLLEDEKDEIKTIKRKNAANVKDFARQLQQMKKKLEVHEKSGDTPSMGSRTSSSNSLDTTTSNGQQAQNSGQVVAVSTDPQSPQEDDQPVVKVIEVDKQMLVEKIVRLQKAHARKNEKLEFLEDHIHHLVEDIQKKTRIIQNYALREETGVLVPEMSDSNKAQITRKGGIMASLYSAHQQDGGMTMELLLDINRKLQAVLEDTLLKNITLKENLDTLGQEIARLSQENRQIQLQSKEER